jgi:NADH dehydrogenase
VILVVGASGRLGSHVAQLLLERSTPVRVMSRDVATLEKLTRLGAEPVKADLRDSRSLAHACEGVETVVAAAHAFNGTGDNTPSDVDDAGNRRLIDTCRAAHIRHFVFTSVHDARTDHPVDFFRIKFRVEEYLRASGLSFTILRPTAFMEFWAALVGQPLVEKGRTTIFGRGTNPVNFVSVADVAQFVLMALNNPAARNQVIEVGGPENLSLGQVAAVFESVAGRTGKKIHVPLPLMRIMTVLVRPLNPALSRQIAAGVYMNTQDQTLDMTETLKRFPVSLRRLEDVVRAQYSQSHSSARVLS